jgi:hypothetical protein
LHEYFARKIDKIAQSACLRGEIEFLARIWYNPHRSFLLARMAALPLPRIRAAVRLTNKNKKRK